MDVNKGRIANISGCDHPKKYIALGLLAVLVTYLIAGGGAVFMAVSPLCISLTGSSVGRAADC